MLNLFPRASCLFDTLLYRLPDVLIKNYNVCLVVWCPRSIRLVFFRRDMAVGTRLSITVSQNKYFNTWAAVLSVLEKQFIQNKKIIYFHCQRNHREIWQRFRLHRVLKKSPTLFTHQTWWYIGGELFVSYTLKIYCSVDMQWLSRWIHNIVFPGSNPGGGNVDSAFQMSSSSINAAQVCRVVWIVRDPPVNSFGN